MAASYVNLSADNSEYLLLLDKSNAYLSLARISINAAYAYCDNHSVGLRLQYTNGNCSVDAATLDLLGNFSYDFKNVRQKRSPTPEPPSIVHTLDLTARDVWAYS